MRAFKFIWSAIVKIPPDYKYLIEEGHFTEQQIYDRGLFWLKNINHVINIYNLQDYVKPSSERLTFMLLCYFSDIVRLKDFHMIETTNPVKMFAYSFYWFLRVKPVQIIKALPEDQKSFLSINEVVVVAMWLCHFIQKVPLKDELKNRYIEEFQYFLKYRRYDAQTLEAILNAFLVGAGENPFY
jgi:hypothetical protein